MFEQALENHHNIMSPTVSYKKKLLALLLYLSIAYYYFGLHVLGYSHRQIGNFSDSVLYLWCLHWYSYAFSHHLNPFISTLIGSPSGYNMTRQTSVFGIYLLSLPFQAFFSMLTAYNIVAIFTPAIAAWTLFLLCCELRSKVVPALCAGYLFGFSAYMLGQMRSPHINLTGGIFLIPLILLLVVRLIMGRINQTGFIFSITLCLTLLFLISKEIFTTFTVCGLIALGLALIAISPVRAIGRRLFLMLLLSYSLSAILLSPYLYYFLTDTLSKPYGSSVNYMVNDLLGFFIPNDIIHVKTARTVLLSNMFTVNNTEKSGYLGLPLIMIALLFFAQRKTYRYIYYLITLLLIYAILSLGTVLRIAGIHVITILPNKLFFHFPPDLKATLPVRFSLYTSLVMSMIVSIWLTQKGRLFVRIGKYSLAFLAILMLLPTVTYYRTHYIIQPPLPALLRSPLNQTLIAPNDRLFFIPFVENRVRGPNNQGTLLMTPNLYQLQCDFCFQLAGGNLGPMPKAWTKPIILKIKNNKPSQIQFSSLQALITEKKVTVIVVASGFYSKWKSLLSNFGVTPLYNDGLWLYRLRVAAHPYTKTNP